MFLIVRMEYTNWTECGVELSMIRSLTDTPSKRSRRATTRVNRQDELRLRVPGSRRKMQALYIKGGLIRLQSFTLSSDSDLGSC